VQTAERIQALGQMNYASPEPARLNPRRARLKRVVTGGHRRNDRAARKQNDPGVQRRQPRPQVAARCRAGRWARAGRVAGLADCRVADDQFTAERICNQSPVIVLLRPMSGALFPPETYRGGASPLARRLFSACRRGRGRQKSVGPGWCEATRGPIDRTPQLGASPVASRSRARCARPAVRACRRAVCLTTPTDPGHCPRAAKGERTQNAPQRLEQCPLFRAEFVASTLRLGRSQVCEPASSRQILPQRWGSRMQGAPVAADYLSDSTWRGRPQSSAAAVQRSMSSRNIRPCPTSSKAAAAIAAT